MTREEYRNNFWKRAYESAADLVVDAIADADRQTHLHMAWADNLPVPPWFSDTRDLQMMGYVERNPR